MGSIGTMISNSGALTIGYAERLMAGIDGATAARFASPGGKVIVSNHPVFVYGHLAIYTSGCMEVLGLPVGVCHKPAGWDELFKNGVECKDDPAGTIYPKWDEVKKHFSEGHKALMAALPGVGDEVFLRKNPREGRMAELLPTIGAMLGFLVSGHPMSHLGQVSAWRRMMGLPAA